MALTWDTTDIENNEDVCFRKATVDDPNYGVKVGDRLLNPVTNALIWHSLNTGIGTITEANAAEVYARIHFVESLYGASLMKGGGEGERPITPADIQAHIGLTTNVSFKDESRTSFLKRHAASHLGESVASYARNIETAEVTA